MKESIIARVVALGTIIGGILSAYAVYVEHESSINQNFEALCDISEEISCSKVFTSEYGRVFSHLGIIAKESLLDLPNALYGFVFYIGFALIFLFFKDNLLGKLLLLAMGVASMVLSAYLSYILSEVMHEICFLNSTSATSAPSTSIPQQTILSHIRKKKDKKGS